MNRKIVKPWQGMLMLGVGVLIVIWGMLILKANPRIVLAIDGVIMCFMAYCFGIKYNDLQNGIKDTIASMLVATLILLSVGVLVAVWIQAGTVPLMIYYGMKILTPSLFLPITCILCSVMACIAGTSWGTLATVGVACMGVAQGLGVPLPVTAGAICCGAFFGDKISPLSDAPILTTTIADVPLMEGIKHCLVTTVPAYLLSLVFFFIYGLKYKKGAVGGEMYNEIINTVEDSFNLSPILLLPLIVVIVMIAMKKPTLPTFVAGIFVGSLTAIFIQGDSLPEVFSTMFGGYMLNTDSEAVNSMLSRGGFSSMLSTVGLFLAAGVFGGPLKVAGIADILLGYIRKVAKTSKTLSLGVIILHSAFLCISGSYYVSFPVIGEMVKDLFPEYDLDKCNLVRILQDTGTGLAPLIPWSGTGAYTVSTLGVATLAFLPYAPMLWLSVIFSVLISITGIGLKKAS